MRLDDIMTEDIDTQLEDMIIMQEEQAIDRMGFTLAPRGWFVIPVPAGCAVVNGFRHVLITGCNIFDLETKLETYVNN